MRRTLLLITGLSCLCLGQPAAEPYARLAGAAKVWNYVKYVHPRVTGSAVDWDKAFAEAVPKILESKTNEDFSEALAVMLAALGDPSTRLATRGEMNWSRPILTIKQEEAGVTLVLLEAGSTAQAFAGRDATLKKLTGKGTVVFDLRGSKIAAMLIPPSAPLSVAAPGLRLLSRLHSGYVLEEGVTSGGYQSTWEMQEPFQRLVSAGPARMIFLVNSGTVIPMVALASQAAGTGAIVSEDAINDEQFDLTFPVTMLGNMSRVRGREIMNADGTMGAAANVVLNKTGEEALRAAMELARTDQWPAPTRAKRVIPPAMFHEKKYESEAYPSMEYRFLAAARIWGVFHYFHPYLHLYGENWDDVLTEFMGKMQRAGNARDYHLAVAAMVARTRDTHCYVASGELTQFRGSPPAIEVRWIENRPVVTRVLDPDVTSQIRPGDVVTKIDGEPVQKRIDELTLQIAASTPQSMMNRVMQDLLSGPNESLARLTLDSPDGPSEVSVKRTAANRGKLFPFRTGEIFRLINSGIGYVDLARLPNDQVDAMFEKFKGTKAILMDMRGYPQGTAWSIAPRLSAAPTPVAAQFRRNVVTPDGIASHLFEQKIPPRNGQPLYTGRTVMLIDERAISQSEHSGLFYKAANGTIFIGSPTAGANGDVTSFFVPGGIRISFSGHDVRWPDGKQLQRVGLVPDVAVAPTIEGIRAGRDEVLLRAIAYVEQGQ